MTPVNEPAAIDDDDETPSPLRPPVRVVPDTKDRPSVPPLAKEEAKPEKPPANAAEQLEAADAQSQLQPATAPDEPVESCPLKDRFALVVKVVGARDRPIADVVIELRKSDTEALSAKTNTEGAARFEGLVKQGYTLSLPRIDSGAWELLGDEALPHPKSSGDAPWSSPAAPPASGPPHIVAQGECISEIAARHGFLPATVWDWPANQALKEKRKNKNVLARGDEVALPDRRVKRQPVDVGKAYKLRHKIEPEVFKTRFLLADGAPRKGVPYLATLVLGSGEEDRNGETDGDGYVTEAVPPDIDTIKVVLGKDNEQEVFLFRVAHLDPVGTVSGVQSRLTNLGYACGDADGELGPLTKRALEGFQRAHGLKVTGEADDATKGKLEELHLS